jgi:hypothetical protein
MDQLISPSERATIEARRIEAVAACLVARGFDVVPPDTTHLVEAFQKDSAMERFVFGIAGSYLGTLGVADFLEASASVIARVTPAKDYGPSYSLAEIGNLSDSTRPKISIEQDDMTLMIDADGCVGKSYLKIFGSASAIAVYTQLANSLQSTVDIRLLAQPAVANALQTWSSCSSSAGYVYKTPAEAISAISDSFSTGGLQAARHMESKISGLLHSCEVASNLYAAAASQQPTIERQVINESQSAADELRSIVKQATVAT